MDDLGRRGETAGLDVGSPLDYLGFPILLSFFFVLVLGIHSGVFPFSGMLGRYPGPDNVMDPH
jgi:hypothetical protein